jgi:hypothetical protein
LPKVFRCNSNFRHCAGKSYYLIQLQYKF